MFRTVRLPHSPLFWFVAVAAVCAATLAGAYPLPTTDTLVRYAPMAEAFAAGNWQETFHPRFNVGMPIVAGLWHLCTGMDALSSCSIVASLAWAAAILPLFWIAERVYDRRAAWFAVLLYVASPQVEIWAQMGLREPFKILGLLLLVTGILGCENDARGWRSFTCALLGVLFLVTFKVDAIPIALLLLAVYFVARRFDRQCWILAGWTLITVQPACYLGWKWMGYWLPSPHFINAWQKVFGA